MDTIRVDLKGPITLEDGTRLKTLVCAAPTGNHVFDLGLPAKVQTDGEIIIDFPKIKQYLLRLTEPKLTAKDIDQLAAADCVACANKLVEVFF